VQIYTHFRKNKQYCTDLRVAALADLPQLQVLWTNCTSASPHNDQQEADST